MWTQSWIVKLTADEQGHVDSGRGQNRGTEMLAYTRDEPLLTGPNKMVDILQTTLPDTTGKLLYSDTIESFSLRLYKMRVLRYYLENKAQLETWK